MHQGKHGILQSPGFPRNYPRNINCKWVLVAEQDSDNVQLRFTYVAMEKDYDKLTVCLVDECREQDLLILTGEDNYDKHA